MYNRVYAVLEENNNSNYFSFSFYAVLHHY
jgi:hypothetical protein